MSLSSGASAPRQPMHRGQLPTDCCRHARVDGPQRPSGRTALPPAGTTPHNHHVAGPVANQAYARLLMGAGRSPATAVDLPSRELSTAASRLVILARGTEAARLPGCGR